jgi:hypothetical protein
MTDKSYIYRGEPESRVFGPLPQGDYSFVVSTADEPYFKNDKWILAVKLTIQPQGIPIFANPWSGVDRNGEFRDGIAEFLLAVNRAPAPGDKPEWGRLIGAKGKCRLKVEIASQGSLAGKEVNKVAFFHRPKQVGPATEQPRQSFTQSEIKASQAAIGKTLTGKDADLDVEPDDIPF